MHCHGLVQSKTPIPNEITLVSRVEPTLASHTFLVYGEACFKDEAHPNCTHTEAGMRPQGKLFSLDLEHILGNEWQVSYYLLLMSVSGNASSEPCASYWPAQAAEVSLCLLLW